MLLVALTIFVSLSAISAADVNNDRVEFATFSNESGEIYGEPIYAQSLHDDYDDLPDIELIKQPSTTVDNLEDDVNNDTVKVATFRSINESNDGGAIYAIPYQNNDATHSLHDDYDDLSDIELIKNDCLSVFEFIKTFIKTITKQPDFIHWSN